MSGWAWKPDALTRQQIRRGNQKASDWQKRIAEKSAAERRAHLLARREARA